MKTRPVPATNCIQMFFHCGTCLPDKPIDQSPSEWSALEVGWTPIGLQVRCKRCDRNIVHIDFEGQRHPANTTPRDL